MADDLELCSGTCEEDLAVWAFSDCEPEVNLSEIEFLIVGNTTTAPISDLSSVAEWSSRLSNTSTDDPNALRIIRVVGDKPAPTDQDQIISGGRTVTVSKTHVINADVDETNQTNWDAARKLQCSGQKRLWYVTRSGHVFGGNEGIAASLKINDLLNRGEGEYQRLQIVATWQSKFMPERAVWPLFGMATYGGAVIGG